MSSKKYTKKELHEHILAKPDMYIGSMNHEKLEMLLIGERGMEKCQIIFVAALLKIFDEIIVNCRDVATEKDIKYIKVNIDKKSGKIIIENHGGITIKKNEENPELYDQELIFGSLLSSDKYDDSKGRITGGKYGYGAKLANIFSKEFEVETHDGKKSFVQKYTDNMYKKSVPEIGKSKEKFTRISFIPDYVRFEMEGLSNDMYRVFMSRTHEIAACTKKSVRVSFNDTVAVNTFYDYATFFGKDVMIETNSRWSIGIQITKADEFNHVSFVNGVRTVRGGYHVNHVKKMVCDIIKDMIITKKGHEKLKVNPAVVSKYLNLIVLSTIEDPEFTSQSKDELRTPPSKWCVHKKKCTDHMPIFSEQLITKIKKSGLDKMVLADLTNKSVNEKVTNKKKSLNDIETYIPAPAIVKGTKDKHLKTLCITEGKSAGSHVVAAMKQLGTEAEYIGIYTTGGVPICVKDDITSMKTKVVKLDTLKNNKVMNELMRILGLGLNKKDVSRKDLTYDRIMLITDQDVDGTHIKGIWMNNFTRLWPKLSMENFITTLNTPIIKVFRNGKPTLKFYNLPEFLEWREKNIAEVNKSSTQVKYYKGLATNNDLDAAENFANLEDKKIIFTMEEGVTIETLDTSDDMKAINIAFETNKADKRKEIVMNFDETTFLEEKSGKIPFIDFFEKEFPHYVCYNSRRMIPGIDGLKPCHRKILYSMMSSNMYGKEKSQRVAQLAAKISHDTDYPHGEASLIGAIVIMAQNYPCSGNNINLLYPNGTFGSRMNNGEDHGQPRYIYSHLNDIVKYIFKSEDTPVLKKALNDNNEEIEPKMYAPIIPFSLVNGGTGIGSGFSTSIPSFNPINVIENTKKFITTKKITKMTPWYYGFKGEIEYDKESGKTTANGCIEFYGNTIRITEIPPDISLEKYKSILNKMKESEKIISWEHGLNSEICPLNENGEYVSISKKKTKDKTSSNCDFFDIVVDPDKAKLYRRNREAFMKDFKLSKSFSYTNMHLHNSHDKIQKFESMIEIYRDFYEFRKKVYEDRKEYNINKMNTELNIAKEKARFIKCVIDGNIKIVKKTTDQVVSQLEENEFTKVNKRYDYLTTMHITSLTNDKYEKLLKIVENLNIELKEYQKKTIEEMWISELDELLEYYKTTFCPERRIMTNIHEVEHTQ